MLSLESISTVKSAVQTCLLPELKREILCAKGSEYDITKAYNLYERKGQWNEIVERKARELLTNQGLPAHLQDNVVAIVPAIGLRMLIWAEYHEGTVGFTREYSIGFLKYSHFTLKGVIDNIKAARELVEDDQFSMQQKYMLACIYCFIDKIDYLYRQTTEKGMQPIWVGRESKWNQVPEVVKFWTHQQMGLIDAHNRNRPLYQCRIEQAIKSGSKAAVEYFWVMTGSRYRTFVVSYAALEVLRNEESMQDDWIVFRDQRYNGSEESWVPNDYYVDILSFLLSKMIPEDQKEFLWRDTDGFSTDSFSNRSRVLEYFLRFPYQDHFMKTAATMWHFLPRETYAVLLLQICDKMESQKRRNLYYGEEKCYRYKSLLKEFWCQSPDRYKRYVFENRTITYKSNTIVETKTGFGLLMKFLSLKKFTIEDEENFRLIITSASNEERESIFSSKEWRKYCIKLMKEDQWEILHRFVLTCFSSKEEAEKFKRELSFTEEAKLTCIDFLKNNRLNTAESFIEWNSLPEQIIKDLKSEIIYSKHGKDECVKLLTVNRLKTANKFISWCLPSNGEAIALKAKLVSELSPKCRRIHVTGEHVKELVNNFTRSQHATKKQVNQLKNSVAYTFGYIICEELISDYSLDFTLDENNHEIQTRIEFRGGKWEKVDEFLTWCFITQTKIDDFKKHKLHKNSGVKILLNLIKSKQLQEAQKFLVWLGLSEEEQKKLKKKTLFLDREVWLMFSELAFSKERDELCSYFHKQEERDEILRWFLSNTHKETILIFRDAFIREYGTSDETDLKRFNDKIERYLTEWYYERYGLRSVRVALERILGYPYQNQSGVKRKAGTFPSTKKHCCSKSEETKLNMITRSMEKRRQRYKKSLREAKNN